MKGRWKIFTVVGYLMLIMTGCGAENAAEDKTIDLPETETIATVQYNITKFPAEQLGTEKLASLVRDLESLQPLEDEQLEAGDSYVTISLIYKDESRDVFRFWEEESGWYAQTSEGNVYENAEFLENYIATDERAVNDVSRKISVPEPSWAEFMKVYGEYDACYDVIAKLVNYMSMGYSLKSAAEIVETEALREEAAYQYAVSRNLDLTEEEMQRELSKLAEEIKEAANYSELEAFCSEIGTTVEAEIYKREQNIRRQRCIEALYQERYDAFRCGDDMVNGITYNDLNTYWYAYLDELASQQDIDVSEAETLMENALEYVTAHAEQLEEIFGGKIDG